MYVGRPAVGSPDVHDRVCAEQNVSDDGEAFRVQTLREEAIGGGMVPERPAQLDGGVASGLGGFGELRLKALGLGGVDVVGPLAQVVKSGSTRSMPSWSGVGNTSPVSTTTIRPSYSSDRHVLADLPQSAQGENAQRAAQTALSNPRRSRAAADLRDLVLVHSTSGSRNAADLDAEQVQTRLHGHRAAG